MKYIMEIMNVTINLLPLWLIIVLKCASGQVNRSSEKLQKEFYEYTRYEGVNSIDWYHPHNMSNFAKFMVCVDVWQKMDNKRVMGGKYTPLTADLHIPLFEVHETSKLKISHNFEQLLIPSAAVIHCPLNIIIFEKNSLLPGPEFYITCSIHEYCLYLLHLEYYSVLTINAEVCGLLVDIKYNTKELEEEYVNATSDSIAELSQTIWDEIIQMNNENRFVLCMDVYEKITRTFTYTGIGNDEIPVCKNIPANLILKSSGQNKFAQYMMVLQCPMNKIQALTTKLPSHWHYVPIIHLTKSIHSGCVYVLEETKNKDLKIEEDDPDHSFFIKAELCGLLGYIRSDVFQLEIQYLGQRNYLTESDDYSSHLTYKIVDQLQLCTNIYRKLYKKMLRYCTNRRSKMVHKGAIEFKKVESRLENVTCVHCPMKIFCSDALDVSFYAADSINLGCVYILRTNSERKRTRTFNIEQEICDVYPFQHLLRIKNVRINYPILMENTTIS